MSTLFWGETKTGRQVRRAGRRAELVFSQLMRFAPASAVRPDDLLAGKSRFVHQLGVCKMVIGFLCLVLRHLGQPGAAQLVLKGDRHRIAVAVVPEKAGSCSERNPTINHKRPSRKCA